MNVLPRLLLVEDKKPQGQHFAEMFANPSASFAATLQVKGFEVTWVRTARDALDKLRQAAKFLLPFDIMVFDLGIPEEDPEDEIADPSTGLRVLRELQQCWNISACAAIVILSGHTEMCHIRESFLAGADNYVVKQVDELEMIYQTVVFTYGSGRRRLYNQWLQLRLGQEEQWHLIQSCSQTADRMAGVVSAGISAVMNQLGDLTSLIEDQYQLNVDRDKDEPICQKLLALESELVHFSRSFAQTVPVNPDPGELEEFTAEEILAKIVEEFRAGIFLRQLRLERPASDSHQVRTFRKDFEAVLKALLFDAIEVSDEGALLTIDVETQKTDWLAISFQEGSLKQEGSQGGQTSLITKDRQWRLSLARRVASNLEAHIDLESGESRSIVTLHIPVNADD